jgi:hypothetical protein
MKTNILLHVTAASENKLTSRRRLQAFPYFNLRVANMRQHLGWIAHVEQRPADPAIHEMIDLGFGDAV